MKGKFIRITLAVAVAIIGFSAFGCSGIPMPDKYKTSVEHVKFPDYVKVNDLDIVTVEFDIAFEEENSADVNENQINELFDECRKNGTCGTTARLHDKGKKIDKMMSSTCRLSNLKPKGSSYTSNVSCTIPIPGGMKEDYTLMLTTVAPGLFGSNDDSVSLDNLVFSSSPEIVVTDGN